jgi:hypothetical protein
MSHTCSLTENKSGDTITYHVSCNPKYKANMSAPSAPSAPVSKPIASNAASRAPSHDAPKPLFNVRPHMLNHAPSAPKKSGNKKKSQQAPINSATVSTAVSAPPPHDMLDEEKRTLDAMIAEMQAYFQQNMKNKNKEEKKQLRKELNNVWSPRIKQQRDIVNVIIQNASSNPPAEIDLINKKITRVISEIHQLLNTVQGGRRTKKTRRKHTRRKQRKHTKTTRRMIFHR